MSLPSWEFYHTIHSAAKTAGHLRSRSVLVGDLLFAEGAFEEAHYRFYFVGFVALAAQKLLEVGGDHLLEGALIAVGKARCGLRYTGGAVGIWTWGRGFDMTCTEPNMPDCPFYLNLTGCTLCGRRAGALVEECSFPFRSSSQTVFRRALVPFSRGGCRWVGEGVPVENIVVFHL